MFAELEVTANIISSSNAICYAFLPFLKTIEAATSGVIKITRS